MTKQIFPIKTESACLLKWAWSSIFFNLGATSSCHRTTKHPISLDNFTEFHNIPEKISDRNHMLRGSWPGNGCEYCKQVEYANGISDRIAQLAHQESHALTPPELHTNQNATSVTPTILEVWFTNTCNMLCTYCGPHHSSRWEQENRKFQKNTHNEYTTNTNYDQMVDKFWAWLSEEDRYKVIQRYHILGGEPFLLKELDDSIEFWNNHANPDLVFSVISNLNIPHARFQQYIKKFEKLVLSRKIWKLQLTASLDGWGPQQEYVRYGLDLNLWQKNFEYLLDRPWISLSVNSVISSLTIKQFPDLVKKINEWNKQQITSIGRYNAEPILHSAISSKSIDNIYSFGPDVFDQDFEKALAIMPEDTKIQRSQKDILQGMAITLKDSSRNTAQILKLKNYLDDLDSRRKLNWRHQFPWLDQDFNVK
jgi:hypothetical protein